MPAGGGIIARRERFSRILLNRMAADFQTVISSPSGAYAEGLEFFRGKEMYLPAFTGARKKFRTAGENVPVEVITSGEYPGDGLPKTVRFPNPDEAAVVIDGIKTLSLEKLVELKLTPGISAADRLKDLADVRELIKIKDLGENFAEKVNEYVRPKYLELGGLVAVDR